MQDTKPFPVSFVFVFPELSHLYQTFMTLRTKLFFLPSNLGLEEPTSQINGKTKRGFSIYFILLQHEHVVLF